MKNNVSKKTIQYYVLMALTALIPVLICLWYINSYAVNVFIFDGWNMMLSSGADVEAYRFTDLFAQNNEHRMPFVILLYFWLLSISNFSSIFLMKSGVFIILLMDFIIMRYIATRSGMSDKKKYFFAALISFLLFSLTQEENLLWGFQISFLMVLFFSVLSCYFLYQMSLAPSTIVRVVYFVLALLSVLIDSFSSIQGLLTWITGLAMLFVMFRKKTFFSPYFIAWTIMAIASWMAYFHNYIKPEHHPSLTYLFEHPGTFVNYFFSIIGNAVSGNFKTGVTVIGIVLVVFLLIACIKIWKNKQVRQFIFPLALVLNSLLVLGSIAIGRAGFGTEQALASRYTSFSICLVVGIFLLWSELKDKMKKKTTIKNLTRLLAVMLFISIPLTMTEGIQKAKWRKVFTEHKAYLLETARMQPDEFLKCFYAPPDSVRSIAARMERKKLNVFHNPHYAVPALLFNDSLATVNNEVLQFVQNTIQFAPNFMVVVRPVVHSKYKSDVKALYADIDGQLFPLYYKPEFNNRPPNPAWENDISTISNRMLSKGMHAVKFKALRYNNAGYYVINPNWIFEIK
jgi:hypothetical protein